jgi:hypothetical protein
MREWEAEEGKEREVEGEEEKGQFGVGEGKELEVG